ncbi:galactosyldiacylglycerol synthase [Streptomyces sp. NPDC001380]|uniref:MGDG synthase family glycosyltransferase n=1 Tax=Streptomyces sp. NPDC001380 TaxID=3364566 RepID=UPI0036B71610
MVRRFLVLSARMGAGHNAVAAELGRRLSAAGHHVARADVLDLLPAGLGPAVHAGYRGAVRHLPWAYGAVYAAFFRPGAGPRPGSAPLARLAERRLLSLVRAERTDAVVPVFHLAAQLTGGLRAQGRLAVPAVVVVTDFAVHRQWLHPGNDLHLCVSPGAAEEVRRSGAGAASAPGPVVPPRFGAPAPGTADWRRLLSRAGGGREPVLVSAGAWGAGSGLDATAGLVAGSGRLAVVLCGRDERLRRRLGRLPGVLALGWVADLAGLMGTCGALVDNAAGQTAVQALAAGLPVVGHRPIPGHGAAGVRRMAELGVSGYARTPGELLGALDALSSGAEPRGGGVRERQVAAGRALFAGDAAALVAAAVRERCTGPGRAPARWSPDGRAPDGAERG